MEIFHIILMFGSPHLPISISVRIQNGDLAMIKELPLQQDDDIKFCSSGLELAQVAQPSWVKHTSFLVVSRPCVTFLYSPLAGSSLCIKSESTSSLVASAGTCHSPQTLRQVTCCPLLHASVAATMNGTSIPTMKTEHAPSSNIKSELGDTGLSPYMDEDDVYEEDAGDLDFSQAQQQLWLSHIPRSLWESWSLLGEDDEIEIGTMRVEGSDKDPRRVRAAIANSSLCNMPANVMFQISLKLHDLPQFKSHAKEYTLLPSSHDRARVKKPGSAFVFSEKDLPGYKARSFATNEVDEYGNPTQGRSFLYEKARRDAKKKENKGKFEPYSRRPIPKQTAVAGVVTREFECTPVKNAEYLAIEKLQAQTMLKVPEKEGVSFTNLRPANYAQAPGMSMADRTALTKASRPYRIIHSMLTIRQRLQAKRQAAKDNRSARLPHNVLLDKLLELFREHRIWGLRDMKKKVDQPEAYVREILSGIAFMWKNGDFNGKWELKPEYKERDLGLMNSTSVAPDAGDSDPDPSGMDDDEDNEAFEDVA